MRGKFSNKNPIWSFRRCFNKRLGVYFKGVSIGGKWSKEEKHFHINVLELLALKFAILTFTKNLSHLTIHVQVDNKVALAYLLKMGGTRSPQLLKISKSIWNYLLSHQITITAEYLPSRLNVRADWESRNATDSSDWKLHQKVDLKITKLLGTTTVDLFASRLCHQLPQHKAWKPDLNSFVTDAMQQDWNKMFGFAFPLFSLIGRVINKVLRENVEAMILVTPTWQTQAWYTLLLRMSIQRPLLLPAPPNLLLNTLGEKHPLVKTRSLRLAAWKITGKPWKSK